jgi:hypothetical protein
MVSMFGALKILGVISAVAMISFFSALLAVNVAGSPDILIAQLHGKPFTIGPAFVETDATPDDPGKVVILASNITADPISIVGLRSSCPCLAVSEKLPIEVPPRGYQIITASVNGSVKRTSATLDAFVSDGRRTMIGSVKVSGHWPLSYAGKPAEGSVTK